MLDLASEDGTLSLEELETVHRAKTGALMTAAVVMGGLAARAPERTVESLRAYGEAIGLAFQIADDVLDATSTTTALGKTAGRDAERNKRTYPALLGVEGASALARAFADAGCAALARVGILTPAMESLATFSVTRRR